MSHPPVTALLGDSLAPEVAAHVASCAACRQLVSHGESVTRAVPGDLLELPIVDPALFARSDGPAQRGGMGKVLVARDRRLGREVVLKQPLGADDVPDPVLRATLRIRFEREARLTARLEHPAIVGIYEVGRFTDGQPFYAMRLVRGDSLDDEIAKRPTLAERIALLPKLTLIAEALAYAHSRGIVHRDVKPANIVLGEFGQSTLIDWGLATELADSEPSTSASYRRAELPLTEYGVGTPGYMAPEQAAGAAAATPADVYAFGATLFHVLAGERREQRALGEVCPSAPPPLIALVERAMAERPEDRIDAPALAAELHRFQTGRLLESHRYTPRELLAHAVRRFRVPIAIAAIALIAVIVLSAIYVRGLARETARTDEARRDAERALRRQLGVSASQLARDPLLRLDALEAGTRAVAPDLEAPTPEAWQGLLDGLAMGPAIVPLVGHRGALSTLALIDRDHLITAGSDHALRTWRLPTGTPLAQGRSAIERAQFLVPSPDRRRLIACGYDAIAELVELDTLHATRIDLDHDNAFCGFSARGAVVGAGNQLRVLDDRGRTTASVALPSTVTALAADRVIVVGLQSGELAVWGDTLAIIRAHPGGVRGVVLDGERVVSAGVDGRVIEWELAGGTLARPTVRHVDPHPIQDLALAPAGIAVLATPNLTDVHALVTTIVRDAAISIPNFVFARGGFSPPDRITGFSPDRLRVIDARDGRDRFGVALPPRINLVADAGTVLVAAGTDGTMVLIDARSGAESGWWLGHTSEITRLAVRHGQLWSASLDGTIRQWPDRVTQRPSEVIELDVRDDIELATRLDGIVELRRGGVERTLPGQSRFAVLSPDGSRLVTSAERGARVWSGEGDRLTELVTPTATAAAYEHDAIWIGAADGTLTRFVGDRATQRGVVPEPEAIARIEVTTEGLAIGFATMRAILLDRALAVIASAPGKIVGEFEGRAVIALADGRIQLGFASPRWLDGHVRPVHVIATRGPLLASADVSGAVRVWRDGQVIARFAPADLGSPTALAFLDDATLAIGGRTGAIRTMPITPAAAVARACAVLRYFGRACSS